MPFVPCSVQIPAYSKLNAHTLQACSATSSESRIDCREGILSSSTKHLQSASGSEYELTAVYHSTACYNTDLRKAGSAATEMIDKSPTATGVLFIDTEQPHDDDDVVLELGCRRMCPFKVFTGSYVIAMLRSCFNRPTAGLIESNPALWDRVCKLYVLQVLDEFILAIESLLRLESFPSTSTQADLLCLWESTMTLRHKYLSITTSYSATGRSRLRSPSIHQCV